MPAPGAPVGSAPPAGDAAASGSEFTRMFKAPPASGLTLGQQPATGQAAATPKKNPNLPIFIGLGVIALLVIAVVIIFALR
jgi:hypothetical protein